LDVQDVSLEQDMAVPRGAAHKNAMAQTRGHTKPAGTLYAAPAAKGGALRGRVATLEKQVTTVTSYVGTLETEVLGRSLGVASLLQIEAAGSDVDIEKGLEDGPIVSLKGRIMSIEDKVDTLQNRVRRLRHEVLG